VARHADELINRFMAMRTKVHGFAWAIVGDYQAAEDVFQETSVVVLKRRNKFRDGTNFEAWIMEIARRIAFTYRRRLARNRAEIPPQAVANMEQAFTSVESDHELQSQRVALRKCLGKIQPSQKKLISERYLRGRSLSDLARECGGTAEALRSRIRRLRQILFNCVSKALAGGTRA